MKACDRNPRGLILTDAFLISEGVVEAIKKVNADLRVFIAVLRKESTILDGL